MYSRTIEGILRFPQVGYVSRFLILFVKIQWQVGSPEDRLLFDIKI